MKILKNTLAAGALLATVAVSALAISATSAAADVACNRYGDCWKVSQRYTTYPRNLRVTFHDDAWRDLHSKGHRYHWREDRADDHVYYNRGQWRPF